MADLFDKCAASTERAAEMRATRSFPYGKPVDARDGTIVTVDGRPVIMAGSNDYLGLAGDPRVVAGAVAATAKYGASCTGAPIMTGTIALHRELEGRLAAFLGREAAVVATTGFQTNLALATLLGRDDAVFADAANHASLVDAARLGFARHRRYRHADLGHLERLLTGDDVRGGTLIVTDGLFSMEGDVCDLPGLVALARRHRARLAVDCAHDIGLLGPGGRGVPAMFGLESSVDIVTGTFSKCFGSTGGFIAADRDVVDFFRHHARSIVF
ncbi:MAG TPA: pyridoxal phosphate-dependent aminotransferase family protein, partial [Phytomonospora sp.]